MSYDLTTTKILIIDDMAPMLKLCKSILLTLGFKEVFIAQDTGEAFDILLKEDPDLIITDWVMEPMNGLEFTNKVRKHPKSPNLYVPVIMMTGFSSRLRVEKSRDVGITEFLSKPFTARDLYNRIVQIIEKPRQFVDSNNYFGPDRRRKKIKNYQGPVRRHDDTAATQTDSQKAAVDILKKLRNQAKGISS